MEQICRIIIWLCIIGGFAYILKYWEWKMLVISYINKLVKKYKEWLKHIPEAVNHPIDMVSFCLWMGY